MKIDFFSPINYGNLPKNRLEKISEAADHYFYLGGRTLKVIPGEELGNQQALRWENGSSSSLKTALKVVSYFTIIVPLIVLTIKLVCRLKQNFYLLPSSNRSVEEIRNKSFLNIETFTSRLAPHGQAMIYGTSTGKYSLIHYWLTEEKAKGKFKDALDFKVAETHVTKISDQRMLSQIRLSVKEREGETRTARICKAGLVNLVIENVKRQREELPIIPIIFSIGLDKTQMDIKEISSRNYGFYKRITNSEIRRAYKLSFDTRLPKEVRDVAKATFQFITLFSCSEQDKMEFRFKRIAAPWETNTWQKNWIERSELSVNLNYKPFPWRDEIKRELSPPAHGQS